MPNALISEIAPITWHGKLSRMCSGLIGVFLEYPAFLVGLDLGVHMEINEMALYLSKYHHSFHDCL